MLWIKHACGCGCVYASSASCSSPVSWSATQCPCAGPLMPYAHASPVLNHCGLLGAHIWCVIMYASSS